MLIRTTCFAAIGGFLFGYDLGLIGGALLGFSEDLGITKTQTQEAIVGALKLGAAAGTFIGGALMLRYGRRPAIAATSITGVIGPILMASAQGAGALVLGRVMSGLGIGICAICVPAYLAEIAPAAQRGAVVQVYELMLCVGMLAATAIDWLLHYTAGSGSWRWMVGIPVLPGAVMGLALMVLPESPRWLVMRNEMDKALSTLRTIMDGSQIEAFSSLFNQAVPPGEALAQAEHELMLLWSSVEKDKAASQNRKARVQLSHALPSPGAETEGQVKGEEEASWRDPSPCIPSQLPPSPSPTATTPSQALPSDSCRRPLLLSQHSLQPAASSCTDEARAPFEQLPDKGEVQQQPLAPWPQSKTDAMHQPLLKGSSSSSSSSSAGPRAVPSASSWMRPGDHCVTAGLVGPGQQSDSLLGPGGMAGGGEGRGAAASSAVPAPQPSGASGVWRGGVAEGEGQRGGGAAEGQGGSAAAAAGPAAPGVAGGQVRACEPGRERNFGMTMVALLLDIYNVARGEERRAFAVACCLAIFNQATASTAIINYAPKLLQRMGGMSASGSMAFTFIIAITKVLGVSAGLLLVDTVGRRPLLIWGALGCCGAMCLATVAAGLGNAIAVLVSLCAFIASFSVSWAGIYWVLVSETFSMAAKSPASAAATALLFLSGAVTNLVFLSLVDAMGYTAFLVFAGVAAASAAFVHQAVPETKGRQLADVQAVMASPWRQ